MTEPFKPFLLVTSQEKVLEMMGNGYFLKHFKGDAADYWSLQNNVMEQTPHVVPVDRVFIPNDKIEVEKEVVLTGWFFPCKKKPVVTTYKLKESKDADEA